MDEFGKSAPSTNKLVGSVRWFSADRGYGFLVEDDGRDEIFVHFSAIQTPGFKRLQEGQRVVFGKQQGPKGWLAVDVVPVQSEDEASASQAVD